MRSSSVSARSRQQGPGLRRRPVALVAASELFLRMVRLARLSRDRDCALDYPWGWATLLAPIFMYWILVHVTGIPPLEAQMLRSRGERYRAYQSRTSKFFPLPPQMIRRMKSRMSVVSTIIGDCRTRAVAGPRDPRRDPAAVLAHRDPARRGTMRPRCRLCAARWRRRRSPSTPMPPTPSITRCRRRSSRRCSGPNRKYSSCFYKEPRRRTLQEAEEEALRQTVEHADRRRPDDPRARLRLGFAVAVDGAAISALRKIVAVSNSQSQRAYIESEARRAACAICTSSPPT